MKPKPFDLNKLEQRIKESIAVKNNPTVTLISIMELIKISQEEAVDWLKRWELKHSTTEQVCACGKKMHTFFMNKMFKVICYDCLIKRAFPDLE